MARKPRRSGGRGKTSGGGGMSSLRGGFRSVAAGVSGSGKGRGQRSRPPSSTGSILKNVLLVVLLGVAAVFLLRRFGLMR